MKQKHITNKRRCSTCGIETHKKGGLLGKRSIPITVEGKVYQGRCLACDPFPTYADTFEAPAAVVTADVRPTQRVQEEQFAVRAGSGNGNNDNVDAGSNDDRNHLNSNILPVTATMKPVAAIGTNAERRTFRLSQEQQQEQQEMHHESGDKSNRGQESGKKINHYAPNATQPNRHQSIGAMPPLTASKLPSSRIGYSRRHSVPACTIANGVPKTLEVIRPEPSRLGSANNNHTGDDFSVVSAITMDVHLFQSMTVRDNAFDQDYDDDDEKDDLPPTTYYRRPVLKRAISTKSKRNNGNSNSTITNNNSSTLDQFEKIPRHRNSDNGNGTDNGDGRHSRHRLLPDVSSGLYPVNIENEIGFKKKIEGNELMGSTSSNEDTYFYDKKVVADTKRNTQEIELQPDENDINTRRNRSAETQQCLENEIENKNKNNKQNGNPVQNEYAHDPPDIPTMDNDNDDFPSFIMDDYDYNDDYDHNQNVLRLQQQRQFQQRLGYNQNTSPGPPATSVSSSPSGTMHGNAKLKRNNMFTPISKKDISDTQGILHCLNLEECNPDVREEALCKLFDTLQSTTQHGDKQMREFILEHNVIEAATKSIWVDMAIVEVQEAAMKLLLLIAASTTTTFGRESDHLHDQGLGDSFTDGGNLLSKNESVCDSILFAMQNHATEPGIQLNGCLLFASLAGSSSDNNTSGVNSDGSLSGAMDMILNAMSNHGGSRSIRKAGLQALHHQCLFSVHSERNKKNLIESKLDNDMAAIDLVIYAMEELQQDLVAIDWACQLCWCLTSSEVLLKQMEDFSLHEVIVSVCQHYMSRPAGIGLVEASIGTIGNLAYLDKKRKELIKSGAVGLLLDGLRYHSNQFGISYEATFAMENLYLHSNTGVSSSIVVKDDAVQMLIRGLKTYIESPKYVIQGFRALSCMANQSHLARELICVEEVITLVLDSIQQHTTPEVIATCSYFIAILATGESVTGSEAMIEHGVIDVLFQAMEFYTEEKVHDAVCLALRNLSCQTRESDLLLKNNKMTRLIVNTMGLHWKSVSIQTSACCIFSNLLSKTKKKELAFNAKIVTSITKAMQSHIESSDLLELACGTLWEFVDSFDDGKVFVGSEVIDVVACAMVMHPRTTSTLENACGLLSHLSSKQSLAETIANAQGVNIVAEVMCNNGSSISLLEAGCLTLKNITLACPSFAHDGSVAVSTLIGAMKENINCTSFVKEACELLWVLASEDENIRSKVLALDGISILMKCLEEHSSNPAVETAALGAFNQLARSNNSNIA